MCYVYIILYIICLAKTAAEYNNTQHKSTIMQHRTTNTITKMPEFYHCDHNLNHLHILTLSK